MEFLQPDWPVPGNVRALFTTRSGGVSENPYASLNFGAHVGDAPTAVATNRRMLQQVLGARLIFLNQVHGTAVTQIGAHAIPDSSTADGCWTAVRGAACTIMVADCLPVLFCTADGSCVGAAHAGWRGLCDGILEATVAAIRRGCMQFGSSDMSPHFRLMAWLGPAIGPDAFEVGEEVRNAYLSKAQNRLDCALTDALFIRQSTGKYLADLPGLARLRLARAGVEEVYGNDGTEVWCTFRQEDRFFSHRRDAARIGGSGRMAACIWREG